MKTLSAKQIAELVGGTVAGDEQRMISGVNSLRLASADDASFLASIKHRKQLDETKAGIVLVENGMKLEPTETRTLIFCEAPDKAFTRLCNEYAPEPIHYEPGICPGAYVDPTAKLGENVYIGPNAVVQAHAEIGDNTVIGGGAYIGHYAKVGKNCIINANVSIMHRCILGDRVIIHAGSVIGADGFGYTPTFRGLIKVPQNGIVQIDNDVEIGANSCVDRARFGKTWIKKGAKIDNLVQVGHNVILGESSVLIGQSGVAGSAEIGRGVIVSAQAGVNGHITLGDGCFIAGASAAQRSVPPGVSMFGLPAETDAEYFERHMLPRKVKRLLARIEALETELKTLKETKGE